MTTLNTDPRDTLEDFLETGNKGGKGKWAFGRI